MTKKIAISVSSFLIIFIFTSNIHSQTNQQFPFNRNIPEAALPFILEKQELYSPNNTFSKRPGHYSRIDWQHAIDSVWGPGLPTAEKLEIFDKVWNTIDSSFACFHDITVNWDSLRQVYRTEISGGVSRGRFCAILTKLTFLLREAHTYAFEYDVLLTPVSPGLPLFNIGGLDNTTVGAGVTPLPDSTALVYRVINSHPLGLQKGDIILGYDGIPWKILYKQLIDFELPMARFTWIGGSPKSLTHSMLRASLSNWYLFDTIDIVKFSNGDTVHLPTSLMVGLNSLTNNTEQMDIPGVPKPVGGDVVSYGRVQSTNIGYIYVYQWNGNADAKFAEAVQNLLQTDGLIIDFRYNGGGNMHLSNLGLALLFDSSHATIDMGGRCSPNHLELCPLNISNQFIIPGGPPGYNKPIAVLTGQGAISSGDQVAFRLKYHRHARFFGKSTSMALNSPEGVSLPAGFSFSYAKYDSYELRNPGVYLTHTEFPVDEHVWLTPEKVAQNRDDVVEAAIKWINISGITMLSSEIPQNYGLDQNYPNPFNPVTKIKFELKKSDLISLVIYDNLGREVTTLVNKRLEPGTYEVDWNAENYSSGIYYYKINTTDFTEAKRMMLVK